MTDFDTVVQAAGVLTQFAGVGVLLITLRRVRRFNNRLEEHNAIIARQNDIANRHNEVANLHQEAAAYEHERQKYETSTGSGLQAHTLIARQRVQVAQGESVPFPTRLFAFPPLSPAHYSGHGEEPPQPGLRYYSASCAYMRVEDGHFDSLSLRKVNARDPVEVLHKTLDVFGLGLIWHDSESRFPADVWLSGRDVAVGDVENLLDVVSAADIDPEDYHRYRFAVLFFEHCVVWVHLLDDGEASAPGDNR